MVRWADRFENINVVHHENGRGWEPVEPYHLGHNIRQKEIIDLLTRMYTSPRDMDGLRKAYAQKLPDRVLVPLNDNASVGLKMRWKPPRILHTGQRVVDVPLNWAFKSHRQRQYFSAMVELMQRQDVVPMLAVRQNIFKWALSKYRGDGQGNAGHLQFKLASGAISKKDIPKVRVNLKRFGKLIDECRRRHNHKRAFARSLAQQGLPVRPLLYEQFLDDPAAFFRHFLDALGHENSLNDIREVLSKDIDLKRVHSGHLSEYVENHEELEAAFGHCFEPWDDAFVTA